jgi:ubiquinone/menaquinone biosynthesis C-methylase UbiE
VKNTQSSIDDYFDAESRLWREVYLKKTPFGVIVQQRQAIALKFIDNLQLPKSARVLEIGCGAGFMAVALARRGFRVEAMDHSSAMVLLAQEYAEQSGLGRKIHVTVGDAHKLIFEDESFNLVVALGVLHWLYDPKEAMFEIRRVLTTDGYAVLSNNKEHALLNFMSIPAINSMLQRLEPLRSVRRLRHSCLNTEFNQLLSAANLHIVKNATIGFGPFTIFNHAVFSDSLAIKIQQKLQQYADSNWPILRSSGSQYIVLATKKPLAPSFSHG